MIIDRAGLLAALSHHFGHDAFRPLQEADRARRARRARRVRALADRRRQIALLQLPALLAAGLTVVISPLIALMKDQVDALVTAGIPATYLNSSLAPDEVRERCGASPAGATGCSMSRPSG